MNRLDAVLLLALCAPWANSCFSWRCDCSPTGTAYAGGTLVVTDEPDPGTTDTAVRTEDGRNIHRDLVLVGSVLDVSPERVVLDTRSVDGSEVRMEWTVVAHTRH